MKKINFAIKILIVLTLLFSICTLAFAETEGYESLQISDLTGSSFVGSDNTSKGEWIDKYGKLGYIIPFAVPYLGADVDASGRKLNWNLNDNSTCNESYEWYGDNDETENIDEGFLESWRVYSYSSTIYTNIELNDVSTYPQVPQLKKGTLDVWDTTKTAISSDFGGIEFNFNEGDTTDRVFTVYFSGTADSYKAMVIDATYNYTSGADLQAGFIDGTIIPTGQKTIEDGLAKSGIYVSFLVRGNFTLYVGTPDMTRNTVYGTNPQLRGFFFDNVIDNTIEDVEAKITDRTVDLKWSNTDTDTKTIIYRKEANAHDNTALAIATLQQGIFSFTDTKADTSREYLYALGTYKSGSYSVPNVFANVFATATDYEDVTLEFTAPSYITNNVGNTVVFQIKATKDNGTTVVNSALVKIRLSGRYVGTFIDDVVYEARTNNRGIAQIVYIAEYSGFYNVTASTEYDDYNKYNIGLASTTLTVNIQSTRIAPILDTSSDAILPGQVINITGWGLYPDRGLKVYMTPYSPDATIGYDNELEILQTDSDGTFANVIFPSELNAGLYQIWAETSIGTSAPVVLNAPRILWISDNESYQGLTVSAVGVNLYPSEYGSNSVIKIFLKSDSDTLYEMPILENNPYLISFMVIDVPLGEYTVVVTTNKEYYAENISPQILNIVAASTNPLGLNVSWAAKLNWNNIFNVLDYGAVADDGVDDTTAIWITIRACKQSGGGVVYFPNGVYLAKSIGMYNDIVLMGEDQYKAKILYSGRGGTNMIYTTSGCTGSFGIANLYLGALVDGEGDDDLRIYPDQFMQLGDQWGIGTKEQSKRVSKNIFVKNVMLHTSLKGGTIYDEIKKSRYRGLGIVVIMNSHFVMEDCDFYGINSTLNRAYISDYSSVCNNIFDFAAECGITSTCGYQLIINNVIQGHHEYYDNGFNFEGQHGIFHRDRGYVADNVINDSGTYGSDGEAICSEPLGANYAYGRVLKASNDEQGRFITVSNDNPISNIAVQAFGRVAMLITGGTGIGQVRYVNTEYIGGTFNNNIYLLESERDWDVEPDATSTFCLYGIQYGIINYRNTINDAGKGILLYGNYYDSVIAENYMVDAEGVCVWSVQVLGTNRFNPNYRVTVKNNIMIGVAKTGTNGIGVSYNWNAVTVDNPNVSTFNIEFRNNYIYAEHKVVPRRVEARSEAPRINGMYVYVSNNSSPYENLPNTLIKNILFANNYVEHSSAGMNFSMKSNGILMYENKYTDVDKIYEYLRPGLENTVENVVFRGEQTGFSDESAPIFVVGNLTVNKDVGGYGVSWNEAYDNYEVVAYEIYVDGLLFATTDETFCFIDHNLVQTIEVVAVDVNGLKSIAPLTYGEVSYLNASFGAKTLAIGLNNNISFTAQTKIVSGVDNISFKLSYDNDKFEFNSYKLLLTRGTAIVNESNGEINININITADYQGRISDMITFKFDVKDESLLNVGDICCFNISDLLIKQGEYVYNTLILMDGEFNLVVSDKATSLDMNGDNVLNNLDYNEILNYYGVNSKSNNWGNIKKCDLNNDGQIDTFDLAILYYHTYN